ncbi:MAG: hypothetical protein EON61_03500 [Alphaproteobacteria bacterium]|nr:MAG: hypothetical protein EON61_03500 [Alphaproteobacteria bacterium]
MSDYAQPATIVATAIVSIAIGFGAATWLNYGKAENRPIINPTAWEEAAPAPQVQTVSLTNTARPSAATCSPWEITDVAMEEVLDEMINRGWRPPNQGQAISAAGIPGIAATDPNAPMPYGRSWTPADPNSVAVTDKPVAEPLPVEPTGASPQPVAIDQPAPVEPRPEG